MRNLLRSLIAAVGKTCQCVSEFYWYVRARLQFAIRGVTWPENLIVRGPLGLSAAGDIELGSDIVIVNLTKFNRAGIAHPTQLVAAAGAQLKIGDDTGISGASIYATGSILIGNHVLIGANCRIYDTDFHPVHWEDRRTRQKAPQADVVIGDDVWLGANVTVLKGVTIGARTVVAAGSVVTRSLPPDVLAAGAPAKTVKRLDC